MSFSKLQAEQQKLANLPIFPKMSNGPNPAKISLNVLKLKFV